MERLAIFGGRPVRETKIFYGKQLIEEDDIKAVEEVLRSDFLTCGPAVEKFEKELAEYCGAKYAVAVANGTAALHCACMAAGIREGDEVITTPITFAASANSVLYCGGKPVFADIDPETYTIDPKSIRDNITENTKAVIAVDFTGQVVDVDAIRSICEEHNLLFVEDAAHSIGSKYKGKKVGSLADMTCMSFHPVKTITGGEGGAILTNDEELYKKLVLARTHGIVKNSMDMETDEIDGPWYYEQVSLGYNYRLTDIQCALLSSQLKKLDVFAKRRREIVDAYNEAFKALPGIILQKELEDTKNVKHLYVIRLDREKLNCTRREFFDALAAENIQCQVHYIPVYWFPYYEKLGYAKGICPNAENLYESVLSIPLYPKMTEDDVLDTISGVTKVLKYYLR